MTLVPVPDSYAAVLCPQRTAPTRLGADVGWRRLLSESSMKYGCPAE